MSGCCLVEGCEDASRSKGLCDRHYKRVWRHGSTNDARRPFDSASEHIEFYSGPSDENGCRRWTQRVNASGYGSLKHDGKYWQAHRLAWTAANGKIPDGLEVDHICRVRDCVNVVHLRLATHKQNMENRPVSRSRPGYLGVYAVPSGRFRTSVTHNGQRFNLGTFDTAEEAAEVVRLKRVELFTHNDADRIAPADWDNYIKEQGWDREVVAA